MRSCSPFSTRVRLPMATLSCMTLRWWSLLSMGSWCCDKTNTLTHCITCHTTVTTSTVLRHPPATHTAGWTPWSWVWGCPSGTLEWQLAAEWLAIIHPDTNKKTNGTQTHTHTHTHTHKSVIVSRFANKIPSVQQLVDETYCINNYGDISCFRLLYHLLKEREKVLSRDNVTLNVVWC